MTEMPHSEIGLIGRAFHRAARRAEAIVRGMPTELDVSEEDAVMVAAYSPVTMLAELILTLPARVDADRQVLGSARDWLDGNYWSKSTAAD